MREDSPSGDLGRAVASSMYLLHVVSDGSIAATQRLVIE
jgi:hypothetical protein